MALTYKQTDARTTRAYERSPGMSKNPGVEQLMVVNPGRPRVRNNPFAWIDGRGQRHQHRTKPYSTLRAALGWKKRHESSGARLYPVDEKGTIVSRPVSGKALSGNSRRTQVAYNVAALRRAMRSNAGSVEQLLTPTGVRIASRGKKRSRRTTKSRRRTRRNPRYVVMNRRSRRRVTTNRRSRRRMTANRRRSRRRVTANRRRSVRRNSRRRRSRRRMTANRRRSRRSVRGNSRRRRSRRRMTANRRRSRRHSVRRNSRRRRTRRNPMGQKLSKAEALRFTNAMRAGHGLPPLRPRRRRRTSGPKRYFGRRRVYSGGKYGRASYKAGRMPAVARVRRSSHHRSGRPLIATYPIGTKTAGHLSRRPVSRRRRSGRRISALAANRRRSRRSVRRNSRRRRRSRRRMTANRRRSRRSVRRNSRRRRSRRRMTANRRRSRRHSVRRNSRRRGSRRRRSLRRNMLVGGAVRWHGRGSHRVGRSAGRLYQMVELSNRRKKGGHRMSGYPVLVPASVSERAYVRRFTFGGAAKDRWKRAKTSGYAERKRYRKSRRLNKNRRHSRRRTSMRRNPRYVVMNKRRRRRLRRNLFGADLMKDVAIPVLGGTAGFVSARVLSNALANVDAIRGLLDKDRAAADAENTKIAANAIGIIATLGIATKVKVVRDHQGALITGMGLALADRLLSKVTGEAAGYLSGMGEYVSQPLGEYVSQPLGEYVSQPLGDYTKLPSWGGYDYATAGMGRGMGATLYAAAGYPEGPDPANQALVDQSLDQAENGVVQAAAGMGATLYAAAGLGAEADASLQQMWAKRQPPYASDYVPTDVARAVAETLPYGRPIPESLVTPEGKGYAGGLFARHLFAGMF